MASLRQRPLLASALVRTELRGAVLRAAPDRLDAAEALMGRLALARLEAQLLDDAGRLGPVVLRTLDAIHVQSALVLGGELEAFVTYDTRQAEAARAAGLPVRMPA